MVTNDGSVIFHSSESYQTKISNTSAKPSLFIDLVSTLPFAYCVGEKNINVKKKPKKNVSL